MLVVFSVNNISVAERFLIDQNDQQRTSYDNRKFIQEIPKKYKEWRERTKLLKEIEPYAKLSSISYDGNIDNEYTNNQKLQN